MGRGMVAWSTRRALAAVVLATGLLAAWLLTAAGAGAHKPRSTAVGVSEREFRVSVYRASVPAGTVRFNLSNEGEDVHDLVVRTARGRTRRPLRRAALR